MNDHCHGGDRGHGGDGRVDGTGGRGQDRLWFLLPEEGGQAARRDPPPSRLSCRHKPIVVQMSADAIVRSAYLPTSWG